MPDLAPPARYFPVSSKPDVMSAGLFRLGYDFGNGQADSLFFQRDVDQKWYRRDKERVLAAHPNRLQVAREPATQPLLSRVNGWMVGCVAREHGENVHSALAPDSASTDWAALSVCIQEDFAVVERSDDADRLVLLSVCFPSGWRPEGLLGKSFNEVHAPVADFEAVRAKQKQLVRAMVERGPYVRFVWSLSADGRLDHHPDQCPRDEWRDLSQGFLRVERQVTVPFADVQGSLFLIRTYLYPLKELQQQQLVVLRDATALLSPAVRAYKGLSGAADAVLGRLASSD